MRRCRWPHKQHKPVIARRGGMFTGYLGRRCWQSRFIECMHQLVCQRCHRVLKVSLSREECPDHP